MKIVIKDNSNTRKGGYQLYFLYYLMKLILFCEKFQVLKRIRLFIFHLIE